MSDTPTLKAAVKLQRQEELLRACWKLAMGGADL